MMNDPLSSVEARAPVNFAYEVPARAVDDLHLGSAITIRAQFTPVFAHAVPVIARFLQLHTAPKEAS